jgi:hypothetical protein
VIHARTSTYEPIKSLKKHTILLVNELSKIGLSFTTPTMYTLRALFLWKLFEVKTRHRPSRTDSG